MNRIILIGNLTKPPELKATPNGLSVCEFTIAVNARRQQDGQESAQYFRVSAWRQLGENCHRYLAKGRKVYVSGPLTARAYLANDGTARVSLEVTADEVEFLSPREEQPMIPPLSAPLPATPDMTPVETDELPF